jgi:hypothetical protein
VRDAIAVFVVWSGVCVALTCAADSGHFKAERLQVPGRVVGLQADDLDADGKKDLVVVFLAGKPPRAQRQIAVFFGAAGSPQILHPPANAAFIDLADIDGDGRRAIVLGDSRGLSVWRVSGNRFEPTPTSLLKVSGLLALPADEDLPFFDVARDWDGDGTAEILIPILDGVAVFTRREEGWSRAGTLRLPPQASHMVRSEQYEPRLRNFAARVSYVIPELVSADYDGDGKRDLCAIYEDSLQVHKGGVGSTVFSEKPSARHALGAKTEAEVTRDTAHVHSTLRDLDGDGVVDLVVNKVSGGLQQMRAETAVFLGKKGGGFDPPAQVLKRDGYSGAISIADLDGDGKPELVMPFVAVGLTEMARVLLSKRMRVGFEMRKNRGRSFSVEPEATREIDFVVDTSRLADVDGPFPSVAGDYNGDGKFDFVAMNSSDQLGVWLGGGEALMTDVPKAIIHVTPSKHFVVTDLDGDKKSDLLIFYKHKEPANTIVVLRNTGRGW